MSSVRLCRASSTALLLLLCVAVLSGCLRYTESLTIGKDDTVSGILVLAARKPGADGTASLSPAPGQTLPQPVSNSPSIRVAALDHEYESGYKVTFHRATFEEVAAFAPLGDKGGQLKISRSGDQLTITMSIDLTYAAKAEDLKTIRATANASLSLTVPGQVLSTDGKVAGQTVTWTLTPLELNTIEATVRSAEGTAGPAVRRSIDPARAALLAAILLALLAAGWPLLRRFRRTDARRGTVDRAKAADAQEQTARERQRSLSGTSGMLAESSGPAVSGPPGQAFPDVPAVPDPFDDGSPNEPHPPAIIAQSRRGGWPPPRPQWQDHR